MSALDLVMLGFFPALMAFAAASDIVSMTISNRISILLVLGFVPVAVVLGVSPGQIGLHLLAGMTILCITFGLFSLNLLGGGDAKLMAATGVWVGWSHLLEYVALGMFLGGPLVLLLLALRAQPLPHFLGTQEWAVRLHHPKTGVPYGIALAAAGLLLYPELPIWHAHFG